MSDQQGQRKPGKVRERKPASIDHASTEELLDSVDRYQARGNIFAQFGSVLTEEEQASAKAEVLEYKF